VAWGAWRLQCPRLHARRCPLMGGSTHNAHRPLIRIGMGCFARRIHRGSDRKQVADRLDYLLLPMLVDEGDHRFVTSTAFRTGGPLSRRHREHRTEAGSRGGESRSGNRGRHRGHARKGREDADPGIGGQDRLRAGESPTKRIDESRSRVKELLIL
jgi:hypothetical protein